MKHTWFGAALMCGLLFLTGPVMAMGSSGDSDVMSKPKPMGPDLSIAEKALDAGQYQAAVMNLTTLAEKHKDNADIYNLIGFAYRKMENYSKSLEYYAEALRLDPDHKGAHEYLGTAYVEMGNLEQAQVHLDRLDKICFFGCKEFTSLKEKIAAAQDS